MNLKEFRYITPRKFFLKLDGFNEKKVQDYRTEMEMRRFFHVSYMNFHLDKTKKYKNPEDWHRFPWEKQIITLPEDPEEIDRKIERMSKAWGI